MKQRSRPVDDHLDSSTRRWPSLGLAARLATVLIVAGGLFAVAAAVGRRQQAWQLTRTAPGDSVLVGPDSVLRRLAGLLQGAATGQPVHVAQIGDSHSANGFFAAELAMLAAGGGIVAPSFHAPYFRRRMTFSTGWERSTWLRPIENGHDGPSGTAAITRAAKATVELSLPEALPPNASISLWWDAPEGTQLRVQADGAPLAELMTSRPTLEAPMSTVTIGLPANAQRVTMDHLRLPAGGTFRFLGFSVDQSDAVVTHDVLGLSGATHLHPLTRQGGALSQFLRERPPEVVLVWYGTNSVVTDPLNRERFNREYGQFIDSVRIMAPDAVLLLMGPPDFARPPARCRANPCGAVRGACRPISHPNVRIIRDEIRSVAATRGLAFLDVYRQQGGAGGILRGYCATQPTAQRDLVHLNEAGYRAVARGLWSELNRLDRSEH